MRIALLELLRSRKVMHPTTILSAAIEKKGTLRLHAAGYPWWSDNEGKYEKRGSIKFVFEGISEGSLDPANLVDADWAEEA